MHIWPQQETGCTVQTGMVPFESMGMLMAEPGFPNSFSLINPVFIQEIDDQCKYFLVSLGMVLFYSCV
jgi:hypothetical protein